MTSRKPREAEHEPDRDRRRPPPPTGRSRGTDRDRRSSATSTAHGQRDDGARVDAHLETVGLDLLGDLEVLRDRGDEIGEHEPHDRATGLVGEQQHLEHTVGDGIGELFLRRLERGAEPGHPRPARDARERLAQRFGTVLAEALHGLQERTARGDRRQHVAQGVGPRGLHLAQACGLGAARSRRPGSAATAIAGTMPTNGDPVTAATSATVAEPAAADPATNCTTVTLRPDCRRRSSHDSRPARRRGCQRRRVNGTPMSATGEERRRDREAHRREQPHAGTVARDGSSSRSRSRVPAGHQPVDAILERRRQRAGPLERSAGAGAREQRLAGEARRRATARRPRSRGRPVRRRRRSPNASRSTCTTTSIERENTRRTTDR